MIKIAQIGVGNYNHGVQIWKTLIANPDFFEVVGYALPENERTVAPRAVEVFGSYPELTLEEVLINPEIEAVTIETEEKFLTKYAILAAKAGKHIYMEKPGGQSLSEFCELIETVRRNKVVLQLGYMYRYNPVVIEVMNKIKNGDLGEIISVEAQMGCYHKPVLRQWLANYKGGSTYYLGCHLIDLIMLIQGKPNKIIPMTKGTGADGVECEDFGFTLFEYPKGVSFAKVCSIEMGGYFRRGLCITGTKANAYIYPFEEGTEEKMTTTLNYCDAPSFSAKSQVTVCKPFNRYENMMKSFAKCVTGEMQNPYSLNYELELYKTILFSCGVCESESNTCK